ncbi:hypothetical protein LJR230_004085 [Trinickia sp. LjRoot230]|uniref:hypothetical protein n=1 Tax=Trinickia sp. LjRoot230 TaxID=3342288 RepID=UPI003ECDDF62
MEAAIGKAHDEVINPRMKRLAESIDSLDVLKDLLTSFDPSNPNLKTDHLSELARAHFLAAAVGQISTFPPEDWREAHAEISKAIDTLSGPMAEYPGFMLDHAVAHDLLAPDVKAAYDRSAQLEQAASSVRDLSGLRARLSEPGIQGPSVPDDTLGFISQDIDGNLGLSMLPRPEPLAVLASRISVFAPDEANAAFCEVFDATDAVQPACRRLPALAALATATGHLGERDRAVAYERLLSTAHSLRTQNAITSEQLAQLLSEVQDTMAQHAGPAEQSVAAQFKRSASIVPPGYRAAYDLAYDLTA